MENTNTPATNPSNKEEINASITSFLSHLAISIYVSIVAYFNFFELPEDIEFISASRFWAKIFIFDNPVMFFIILAAVGLLVYYFKKIKKVPLTPNFKITVLILALAFGPILLAIYKNFPAIADFISSFSNFSYKIFFIVLLIMVPALLSFEKKFNSMQSFVLEILALVANASLLYAVAYTMSADMKYPQTTENRALIWETAEGQYFVKCTGPASPLLEFKKWGYEKCNSPGDQDDFTVCKDASYNFIRPYSDSSVLKACTNK